MSESGDTVELQMHPPTYSAEVYGSVFYMPASLASGYDGMFIRDETLPFVPHAGMLLTFGLCVTELKKSTGTAPRGGASR